jgi:hypothetical protein
MAAAARSACVPRACYSVGAPPVPLYPYKGRGRALARPSRRTPHARPTASAQHRCCTSSASAHQSRTPVPLPVRRLEALGAKPMLPADSPRRSTFD